MGEACQSRNDLKRVSNLFDIQSFTDIYPFPINESKLVLDDWLQDRFIQRKYQHGTKIAYEISETRKWTYKISRFIWRTSRQMNAYQEFIENWTDKHSTDRLEETNSRLSFGRKFWNQSNVDWNTIISTDEQKLNIKKIFNYVILRAKWKKNK